MKSFVGIILFAALLLLQSCEFSCSVGDAGTKNKKTASEPKGSGRILNEIKLNSNAVKVEKAYLVFEDGEMVPDDNVVDFSQSVKLILKIESGWKEVGGKVKLGAAEKITVEGGEVLLNEEDMFSTDFPEWMSAEDAKTIGLTATIKLKQKIRPLTSFLINFRVWDKNSNAAVQGEYKLYAK